MRIEGQKAAQIVRRRAAVASDPTATSKVA